MAVIKDVAALAGVSTGTVSKYLNNPDSLKETTRRKVERAIDTLHYEPHPLARSLRTGRTNLIGVIVPNITNPFFAEIHDSIRQSALAAGYSCVLYTTEDDPATLKSILATHAVVRLDGVVLCFLDEDEAIRKQIGLLQSSIPVIELSWDVDAAGGPVIAVDVRDGMRKAAEHLITMGHRRIGYIGGPENDKISQDKFAGFRDAMGPAGLVAPEGAVLHGKYTLQAGYEAGRLLLAAPARPTAVLAENDILAIGCMKRLLQAGVRIPEDISIVGFDNIVLSHMVEPALTTVALPIAEMGRLAVERFLHAQRGEGSAAGRLVLGLELIGRDSVGQPPVTL